MTGHVKIGGAWKDVDSVSVRVGGAWKEVSNGYTKIAGVWKEWFAGVSYWAFFAEDSENMQGNGIASDSSGNVFLSGAVVPNNKNGFLNIKTDADGIVSYQKGLQANNPGTGYGIVVDSQDNTIQAGYANWDGSSDAIAIKRNNAGTIVWKKSIGWSGGTDIFYNVDVDNNDDYYFQGLTDEFSGFKTYIVKINSSGTRQWDRYISEGFGAKDTDIKIDGSYVYVADSLQTDFSDDWNPGLWKINKSNGSTVWVRKQPNNNSAYGRGVAVDSSGNVYLLTSGGNNAKDNMITKFNSSGTRQWDRQLPSNSDDAQSLAIDSSGNVYGASGRTNQPALIWKIDPSGNLVWQRSISIGTGVYAGEIRINSSNDLLFSATIYGASTNTAAFMMKIPSDGSLTGTYTVGGNSLTYANASNSFTTTAESVSTPSVSNNNAGRSTVDATMTDANITTTNDTTEIA